MSLIVIDIARITDAVIPSFYKVLTAGVNQKLSILYSVLTEFWVISRYLIWIELSLSFLIACTKLYLSLHTNKFNRVFISLLTCLFCCCRCQTFRHPISLSIHRLVRATAHVWKSLQLMCIISSFPNSDFDSFVVVVSHRSSLSSHTYRHIHMHRQYNCVIILWACLCPSWSKNVMQLSVWDLADSVGGTLNWK